MAKIHGFNKRRCWITRDGWQPPFFSVPVISGVRSVTMPVWCWHRRSEPLIETEEVLKVLRKRKGILDGVCVTGGEPTLDPGLTGLLAQIKELGYPGQIGNDGTQAPALVRELVDAGRWIM